MENRPLFDTPIPMPDPLTKVPEGQSIKFIQLITLLLHFITFLLDNYNYIFSVFKLHKLFSYIKMYRTKLIHVYILKL